MGTFKLTNWVSNMAILPSIQRFLSQGDAGFPAQPIPGQAFSNRACTSPGVEPLYLMYLYSQASPITF
jgi:hypothetical protein